MPTAAEQAYEQYQATAKAVEAAWQERAGAADAVGNALADHQQATQALVAAWAEQPTPKPLAGI